MQFVAKKHKPNLNNNMKAIVIGATGSTGEFLVDELLADQDYTQVTIFVRRATGKQNPKLVEHIIDFSKIKI